MNSNNSSESTPSKSENDSGKTTETSPTWSLSQQLALSNLLYSIGQAQELTDWLLAEGDLPNLPSWGLKRLSTELHQWQVRLVSCIQQNSQKMSEGK